MTEQQLEMMDDYLSNRLNASDTAAFEEQVQADPQLAQELDIQKNLVERIRQARAIELKSMLNNVPISPVNGGSNILMKVGTWAVVAGLVVTGLYFYFNNNEQVTSDDSSPISEQKPEVNPEIAKVPEMESEPTINKEAESTPARKGEDKATKQTPQLESAPVKPLDVYVPEEIDKDVLQYEREQMENIKKAFVTSSMEVETDTMNKKYNFHYVFNNSKLILYGAFEKNLYEILEFIGDEKRTVVLFYKSNYYLLDIEKTLPTKLTPIHDKKLLNMLQSHRGK